MGNPWTVFVARELAPARFCRSWRSLRSFDLSLEIQVSLERSQPRCTRQLLRTPAGASSLATKAESVWMTMQRLLTRAAGAARPRATAARAATAATGTGSTSTGRTAAHRTTTAGRAASGAGAGAAAAGIAAISSTHRTWRQRIATGIGGGPGVHLGRRRHASLVDRRAVRGLCESRPCAGRKNPGQRQGRDVCLHHGKSPFQDNYLMSGNHGAPMVPQNRRTGG